MVYTKKLIKMNFNLDYMAGLLALALGESLLYRGQMVSHPQEEDLPEHCNHHLQKIADFYK